MTFPIGAFVKVVNPERKDFGKSGRVYSNYRSGNENQAYGVRLWNGEEYWIPELDLVLIDEPEGRRDDSEGG